MGWTTTSWSRGCCTISAALFNEFVAAVTERQRAIDGTTPAGISAISADATEFQAAKWAAMQQWVEDNLGQFVVSHAGGVKRSADYYDDATSIPNYANLAELFSAAGLSPRTTWSAYTTHPDKSGVNAERQTAAGDIMGHWCPEELQACLSALIWVLEPGGITDTSTNWREWLADWGNLSWATAKSNAESGMYAEGCYDTTLYAWNWGEYHAFPAEPPPGATYDDWRAGAYRSGGYAYTECYSYAKSSVRIYVRPEAVDEWHNQGDWNDADEGKYQLHLVHSQTDDSGTGTVRVQDTDYLGAIDFPGDDADEQWCDEPDAGDPDKAKGYTATTVGLVQYDVTDGFDYG